MVGSIPWDETAEERGVYAKLIGNLCSRPNRDPLPMLCGERHLVAKPLLLVLIRCYVQPTFGGKVTENAFLENRVFENVTIPERKPENERGLSLTDSLQDLYWHRWIALSHEGESARCETFINPY
jgi:hypothetical protein